MTDLGRSDAGIGGVCNNQKLNLELPRTTAVLYLDDNKLSGNIPSTLGMLSNLGWFIKLCKSCCMKHILISDSFPPFSGLEAKIEYGKFFVGSTQGRAVH
jgi:hypothetical protein